MHNVNNKLRKKRIMKDFFVAYILYPGHSQHLSVELIEKKEMKFFKN